MGCAHEITQKGDLMAIQSTAQTISLTCDKCLVIQDRIPVMGTSWRDIARAGWELDREAGTCICPDCIFEQQQKDRNHGN